MRTDIPQHNPMKKAGLIIIGLAVITLALAGCGYVPVNGIVEHLPGFWDGLWHGLLAPYTLIVRLFKDVGMYATPNSGWWYDFGFLLGACGALPLGWLAAIIALFL